MKDFSVIGFLSVAVCLAILNTAHGQRCSTEVSPAFIRFAACFAGVLQLEREVRSLTIDDVSEGPVTISNIRVTSFDIGPRGCDVANTGSSYTITFSDISLALEADWRRKRLFRTRRGTLDVSASDSVLTISFFLGTDSDSCPTISNFGCDFELNNFDVDITGKLLGVIPRRRLPGEIRSNIRDQACGQAESVLSDALELLS